MPERSAEVSGWRSAPAKLHAGAGRLRQDDILRRLSRNFVYLFSAQFLVAGLGLATLSILAFALGPAGLGALALIEAYARTVDRLVRFEPWQSVVRYGAIALENKDDSGFRRIVKAATMFELAGAAAAGLVALLLAGPAAGWLGLSADQTSLVVLFSATLFLNLVSTPTAVLRLFDKFDLIAKFSVVLAFARLGLTVLAWQSSADLRTFVLILAAYAICTQTVPVFFAWRELVRQGHGGWLREGIGDTWRTVRALPALPGFLWNSNVNVILRSLTQRFDLLIVGAVLGPSAAGLYQIARRAGQAAMVIGRPVQQAVYPDIARLWARREYSRFRNILLITNAVIGLVSLIVLMAVAINMELLVRLFFGENFIAAAPMMVVQGIAVLLFLTGNTFNPALLSMGRDSALVRITLVATLAFFVALAPLLFWLGPIGGSLAHVVFNSIWLAASLRVFLGSVSEARERLKTGGEQPGQPAAPLPA